MKNLKTNKNSYIIAANNIKKNIFAALLTIGVYFVQRSVSKWNTLFLSSLFSNDRISINNDKNKEINNKAIFIIKSMMII